MPARYYIVAECEKKTGISMINRFPKANDFIKKGIISYVKENTVTTKMQETIISYKFFEWGTAFASLK